ncbi:MAG: ABC transporter ATP-binding protein [Candidatus Coprenecus sp.]|nr:ABC transporter ATP-binding protein [Candidatus Coprenecus sp.]
MNSNDRIILSAENLSTGYRNSRKETVIQRNLSFSLRRGELTSLIGLNGSGKSTLIKTLCGFLPPLEGDVRIAGKEISRYSAGEFARKVAVVLTDKTYSGAITVRELVSMGRYPHTGWLGKLSRRDILIVDESMAATGVCHKADSFLSDLSDGQRQRAFIAKALAQQAPVIILDEPTAFLDVAGRSETLSLLHRTASDMDLSIFLSIHDIDNALMYSDKIMVIRESSPMLFDTPENLVMDGKISDFFAEKGLFFNEMSGQISHYNSSDTVQVGIKGDKLTARWLSNALFRYGFTPVAPKNGIICCNAVSKELIEVSLPEGRMITYDSIGSACSALRERNISESSRGRAQDEKYGPDR